MSAKVRWSGNPKEPSVAGLKYSPYFEEFKHINAQDKAVRDEINRWRRETHKSLEDLYYEQQQIHMSELQKSAHEIDVEDAYRLINESIPQSDGRGWFVDANSDYKPRLFGYVMGVNGLLNAAWNVAYDHYKSLAKLHGETPMSFKKWLYTPQTLYRGDRGSKKLIGNDRFVPYTPDRSIAEKFSGQYSDSRISEIKIRPIDTLGALQSTAEAEHWIPRWKLKQ